MYTHRERMQACLAGNISDRPPVVLWRHFPVDDQSAENLARATLNFQQTFDFDFVKVTPASSFCLKDWGAEDEWHGDTEGTRRYSKYVIQDPKDWENLQALDPDAPHLYSQLECLRIIRNKLGPETPLVQTIFNPLAQAKNLAGSKRLLRHIREYPEAVTRGLETIAVSTKRFIDAAIDVGIDGIFYAVQHAQIGMLSKEEFSQFSMEHDILLLKALTDLWLNIIHIHGKDIFFNLITEYPFHIVNWHDRETEPSLRIAQEFISKSFTENRAVCGGVSRETIVLGSQLDVAREAADAITQTNGKNFILGTGCVVPITAPYGNILAARQSVENL